MSVPAAALHKIHIIESLLPGSGAGISFNNFFIFITDCRRLQTTPMTIKKPDLMPCPSILQYFRGVEGVAQPPNHKNIVFLQGKNRSYRAGFSYEMDNFYDFEMA